MMRRDNMMRRKKWAALVFCLTGPIAATAAGLEDEAARSRAIVQEFQQRLQTELEAAMKGGPINAIEVCNQKAPAIAHELSQRHGARIGRTSLALRNPKNAPDDWERKVLELFELRKRQGEAPQTLEYYEAVAGNGQRAFRYMKAIAIPQNAPCLVCHGRALDSEVDAKLRALYPEDRARGYQAGDLRGAFTVSLPR